MTHDYAKLQGLALVSQQITYIDAQNDMLKRLQYLLRLDLSFNLLSTAEHLDQLKML